MRALLLVLCTAGCGLIAGVDRFEAVDNEADDSGAFEASAEETRVDAGDDAGASVDTATAADTTPPQDTAAPIDTGPTMCLSTPTKQVAIGTWSIDATEVTNAQYAAFLAATAGDMSGQPSYCSENTSYVPSGAWPAPASKCDHPVVNVDWCDAYAYCRWAKKRLCGSPAGGATPSDGMGPTSAAASQWFAACSANGIASYPYGNAWAAGNCVDNAFDGTGGTSATDTTRAVGSATKCRGVAGAYVEIHDMVGNVREWEDSCGDYKKFDDDCRTRGGSFTDPGDKASCASATPLKRKETAANVGFRCCSP